MRKLSVLFTLLLLAAMAAGCHSAAASSSLFDFSLPEGYEIADITDTTCSILRNGEAVGGIVLTDLDPSVIGKTGSDTDDMSLGNYLESCAQPPLGAQYIAMYMDGHLEIAFEATNFDTGESHRYLRTLFEKDSACYDLWVDGAVEDYEDISTVLRAACLG